MSGNGTFLYPAITNKLGGGGSGSGDATQAGNNNFTGTNTFTGSVVVPSPTQNNQASNKEYVDNGINGCAKLASANTFTQTNTFNNTTTFHAKVNLVRNNNGAFLENFEYANKNYTSLKFFKNNTNYPLQIEVNNTDNTAHIASPSTNNGLRIQNLANPTGNNDATNKQYVDNRVKLIEKSGFSFTRQEINTTAGNQVTKYYAQMNYTNIGIGNNAQILSCYCKTIPASGQHLVITFFGEETTDNLLIEIYQYASTTDITTNLNSATFRIGYING